jgi:hypothetical protein
MKISTAADGAKGGHQQLQAEIDLQIDSTMNYVAEVEHRLKNVGWARKLLQGG